MLAPATITCKRPGCGQTFRPNRLAQLYCSERCRNTDVKRRSRAKESGDTQATRTILPRSGDTRLQPPPSAAVGREGPSGISCGMARRCKATTIRWNITRTDTRSCQRAWTEEGELTNI